MSEERRITSEDLALFAMQLLPEEERAEVAAYVAQSAEARKELAEIQGDLATYALTAEMHAAPVQARERLMRQVAREKKAIPIDLPPVREARATEVGTAAQTSPAVSDATASEGRSSGLGLGGYLNEDNQPKRGVAGKVLPWIVHCCALLPLHV